MKNTLRNIIKIAGIVLIAAGICVVGYYTYDLIATNASTQNSLLEAEQLLGDMAAYTGSPGGPLDSQPPDAAYSPGSLSTDSPDQDIYNDNDDSGAAPDTNAASGPKGTPKPKAPVIGLLILNSLGGRKVPVLEGTSDDALSRGAAHHPASAALGASGDCVIFGHRNTVFSGFAKLKVGDTITLEVPGADPGSKTVYTYSIVSMAVVSPNDPRIYRAPGGHVLTLVTCYPFNYVGAAPNRYIVVADMQ